MTVYSEKCFAGHSILVTGASSGIGRSSAIALARHGARIVAVGRDAERLESLSFVLGSSGGHSVVSHNLANADSTAYFLTDLAAQHGPFTGVFHAAGSELIRPVRMTKNAQLDEVFSSSLFAGFGIARAAANKAVLSDGGAIVLMSSAAAIRGQQGLSAYSAAKAGIDGMVRSLSLEFAVRKIRINSIAAGAVRSPMHDRVIARSGAAAETAYENAHPLGIGDAEDIAAAAMFLLSDAARWITGTTLRVDGGYVS